MNTWLSMKQGKRALALTLCSALLVGCESDSDDDDSTSAESPTVRHTAEGAVNGTEEAYGFSFKGIPYAAAPVGDLRFAAPEPTPMRTAELDATAFGSSCPQAGSAVAPAALNEDCLFLNVYTPDDSTEATHPVMVWIHGGAFVSGSGGESYNPSRLVEEGVTVVTINYRLGALGYMANSLLSAEQGGYSGNYGLMDQKAALDWVHNNISNFGGDPEQVTIFGESAGGHSVLSLVVSPQAAGLFQRAIVQSGSYSPDKLSLSAAETKADAFNTAVSCSDVACLRALSVEDILANQGTLAEGFGPLPVFDSASPLLPKSLKQSLDTGDFNKVPVLMGTNRDEYSLFVGLSMVTDPAYPDNAPIPAASYEAVLSATFGPAAASVASEYPLSAYDDRLSNYGTPDYVRQALSAINTDAGFACSALDQAAALANHVTTYVYEFADQEAPVNLLPVAPANFDLGAGHAFEIIYLLNTEAVMRARGATDAQVALSEKMIDYWTSFAKNSNPNESLWSGFAPAGAMLELDSDGVQGFSAADFFSDHHCGYWSSFPPSA